MPDVLGTCDLCKCLPQNMPQGVLIVIPAIACVTERPVGLIKIITTGHEDIHHGSSPTCYPVNEALHVSCLCFMCIIMTKNVDVFKNELF